MQKEPQNRAFHEQIISQYDNNYPRSKRCYVSGDTDDRQKSGGRTDPQISISISFFKLYKPSNKKADNLSGNKEKKIHPSTCYPADIIRADYKVPMADSKFELCHNSILSEDLFRLYFAVRSY